MKGTNVMKRALLVLAMVAALGCATTGSHPHGRVGATAIAPPIFQVIPAAMDPSVTGLPAAVGTIVQNSGSLSAWVKTGSDATAWQSFPTTGGGLTPIADQTTLANVSGGSANPTATTAAQMRTMLGIVSTMPNNQIIGNVSGSTAAPGAVMVEDTVVVSGSAVASLSLAGAFGGINGDVDGHYTISCAIATPSGSNAVGYIFKPNNTSANQFQFVQINSGTSVATSAATNLNLINSGTTNAGWLDIRMEFEAKTGSGARHFESRAVTYDGTTTTVTKLYIGDGVWNDSSTVVTDMVIAASSGNNIGVGTTCFVRRFVGG